MGEFTPPPWRVEYSHTGYPYQIIAPSGSDIEPGRVGTKITRWGAFCMPSSNEGKANAHLIAEAPLLYAALYALLGGDDKMQVGIGGNPTYVDKFLEAGRATLARARGEQP